MISAGMPSTMINIAFGVPRDGVFAWWQATREKAITTAAKIRGIAKLASDMKGVVITDPNAQDV
jgi:hypothetical protein